MPIPLRVRAILVACTIPLLPTDASAQAAAPDARARDTSAVRDAAPRALQAFVWVNASGRVYHCPGSRFYGTTRDGEFMSEAAARALGNRAAQGIGCPRSGTPSPPSPRTPGEVWVNTESRVYHCPGSGEYARTKRGRFLPEADARRAGHRPARGNGCR